MSKKNSFNTSDIQGFTRIITDATVGIVNLVEDMQKRIVHPAYLPSTPIQGLITGISGIIYKGVRLGAKTFGGGLDKALGQLHNILDESDTSSEKKDAFIAALNGVIGDYLESSQNPLSIPMQFRYQEKRISLNSKSIKEAYSKINGKILLMVHGLCMNDTKWCRDGHNHGEELAKLQNLTPIYLYYNGGRHISVNGQNLNELIEQLVNCWPLPVEELLIIGHSMGGMVSRSAFFYGKKEKRDWTKHVKKIIFLGTPHHGAPLEKAGNYLGLLLEAAPYVKPFARLTQIRSAGITDLRYGNLLDEDWNEIDRFQKVPDQRTVVPLPKNVDCYAIAAISGKQTGNNFSNQIVGDGLVSLNSALGRHKIPDRKLLFEESHTHIVYEINHMELLSKIEIFDKLKMWIEN